MDTPAIAIGISISEVIKLLGQPDGKFSDSELLGHNNVINLRDPNKKFVDTEYWLFNHPAGQYRLVIREGVVVRIDGEPSTAEPATSNIKTKPRIVAGYPIVVPNGEKHEGKQVVLIDLDRISAILIYFDRPREFIEAWGKDEMKHLTAYVITLFNPKLWEGIVSRSSTNNPLAFAIRETGNDDPESAMGGAEKIRAEIGIDRWHYVHQKAGLVLNDSNGRPTAPFTVQVFTTAAAKPNEAQVVVNIFGESMNDFILLPQKV